MIDQEDTSCQQLEEKLKEGIQKLLTDGTIAEILQAQIKAMTIQTRNSREGNRATTPLNEASASVHPKKKRERAFFILLCKLRMMMSITKLLKHHNYGLLRLLT